jgi:predicted RNA-binding Zn-ribbon protein involved in translation (DUF1610 family)
MSRPKYVSNGKEHVSKDYVNPICPQCGIRERVFNYYSKKDGRPLFKKLCEACRRGNKRTAKEPTYIDAVKRKVETLTCEQCGFKAEHPCQLDIDHVDGNHENNHKSNHRVLCANCHRLKTQLNKDYLNMHRR